VFQSLSQKSQMMARRVNKLKVPTTVRTASIKILAEASEQTALTTLQSAYADACNLIVPIVTAARCWNRFRLHTLAYRKMRTDTPLGAQMCCNVLRSVAAAYRSMNANRKLARDAPIPTINFRHASVHFDQRTFTMRGNLLSLYTLEGRVVVTLKPGEHQQRLLKWGTPREAELVRRGGKWFFNLVIEKEIVYQEIGPVLGLATVFVNPAYSSKACYECGQIGLRVKHSFICNCGRRAHSDVNAASNLARLGERALSPRAVVNRPDVAGMSHARL
jgi:hypothetical protein